MRPAGQIPKSQQAVDRLEKLTSGYQPLQHIPDEFIAPDGHRRAHWVDLLHALTELSDDEINRRFATAEHHIRATGVSYRAYGDTSEKSWPLGRLPLLIGAEEWEQLASGVEQRARLMEAVLEDVYGKGQLVAEGAPAAVIAMPIVQEAYLGVARA